MRRGASRLAALAVLVACGTDSAPSADAPTADAPSDAASDAPPIDASAAAVLAACTHVCDKFAVCDGQEETDPTCASRCSDEVARCSAEDIARFDACAAQDCVAVEGSPLYHCIESLGCVR